jgi:hypothetical protein
VAASLGGGPGGTCASLWLTKGPAAVAISQEISYCTVSNGTPTVKIRSDGRVFICCGLKWRIFLSLRDGTSDRARMTAWCGDREVNTSGGTTAVGSGLMKSDFPNCS